MGSLTVQIDSEVSKGWCGLTQAALADALHMSSPDSPIRICIRYETLGVRDLPVKDIDS